MALQNCAVDAGREAQVVGVNDESAQAVSLAKQGIYIARLNLLHLIGAIHDGAVHLEQQQRGTAHCWLRR